MPNIFFTSDTHFGHRNVIKFCNRPFLCPIDQAALASLGGKWLDRRVEGDNPYKISAESVAMMDEAIIEGINAVVKPNDTLYHLGDFHFSHISNYVAAAQSYRQRINCRNVHLIWGNHDNRDAVSPYDRFRGMGDLFSSAQDLKKINVGGQVIILCHYALLFWERSHRGSWCLYGHSHSNAEANIDALIPQRRSMDVGVDNARLLLGEYRPFAFEEVREHLKHRTGSHIDHHIDPDAPSAEEIEYGA